MNKQNTTAETRRESFDAIEPETSRRGSLILDVLGDRQMTVDEIVYELMDRNEIAAFDRNFVAPRLTELKDAGAVEVIGKRRSRRTGKNVAIWAKKKGENHD